MQRVCYTLQHSVVAKPPLFAVYQAAYLQCENKAFLSGEPNDATVSKRLVIELAHLAAQHGQQRWHRSHVGTLLSFVWRTRAFARRD